MHPPHVTVPLTPPLTDADFERAAMGITSSPERVKETAALFKRQHEFVQEAFGTEWARLVIKRVATVVVEELREAGFSVAFANMKLLMGVDWLTGRLSCYDSATGAEFDLDVALKVQVQPSVLGSSSVMVVLKRKESSTFSDCLAREFLDASKTHEALKTSSDLIADLGRHVQAPFKTLDSIRTQRGIRKLVAKAQTVLAH